MVTYVAKIPSGILPGPWALTFFSFPLLTQPCCLPKRIFTANPRVSDPRHCIQVIGFNPGKTIEMKEQFIQNSFSGGAILIDIISCLSLSSAMQRSDLLVPDSVILLVI
jgi:hypothetical protein